MTCGFANGLKATRVNSLTITAGGLQAKGRLSFKTGIFGAIEPPKAANRGFWDKNKNSTSGLRTKSWTIRSGLESA